jgi:predicted amidohydrolase/GNAT superfamily N-acetyltransferase
MFDMATLQKSKLVIAKATFADIPQIVELSQKIYADMALKPEHIKGQIRHFPEGQFVAKYDDKVVGYCATFRIKGAIAKQQHTWREITGDGFASRHDPNGDYLYGMEVFVDKAYRGLRIGQRLYDERKNVCQALELNGIIFGGRMPGFYRQKDMTAEEYVDKVQSKVLRDPVINFQVRNGSVILGILKNYLTSDRESRGYAVHMLWKNPLREDTEYKQLAKGRKSGSVRVAAVQFQARKVESFDQFIHQVEYFVDVATDYRSDFVLFPELLTIPLLSAEKNKLSPQESILKVTEYTKPFVDTMQSLALSYNINIIGGSHPTLVAPDEIQNISYIFLRDGSVHSQPKLHPTPNEKHWWNIKGGNQLKAIDTDCGPIGVLICYDAEFPEAARYLADQGALIIFVPFCTDEKQGYQRVRYCSQARAIENQLFVVMAGMVGNLPDVENMDIHYAESAIITPCDFPFSPDGVAASSAPNTEMIVFADLRLEDLILSRNSGTVTNFKDRRFDLYRVDWKG